MPKWLAVLTALILPLSAFGQEKQTEKKTEKGQAKTEAQAKPDDEAHGAKPKLGIGDAAPALKVSKWLKGGEIKEFASGKVYVVEFWATWCGPCIASMPHLTELQAEYKDKGLTIIGLTSSSLSNTAEQVNKFMEGRGSKFEYTFAFADDATTTDAYLKAAGQNGIPCSFVVDKSGKVAYIGHPLTLDDVLPKVIDGSWKGQEDIDAIAALDKEFEGILAKGAGKPDEAVKELAEFEKQHPNKAKQSMFVIQKMMLFSQAKKFDDLVAMSAPILKQAEAKKDASQLQYVSMFLTTPANTEKKGHDVAIKALELGLKINGEKDLGTLFNAARVYAAVGNKAKLDEYGKKAVEAAEDPDTKAQVEQLVKRLKGENPEAPVPAAKVKKPAEKP